MKKLFLIIPLLFTLFVSTQQLQATTGTGVKAISGNGKNVGAIYWLNFGRNDGEYYKKGDKSVFTTTNKITYTVKITNIKTYKRTKKNPVKYSVFPEVPSKLKVVNYDDWPGSNFQNFYKLKDEGKNKAIGFFVKTRKATFDLEVTAIDKNGNPVPNKNIIIAGTESLGDAWERYGMTVGTETDVHIIEGYKTINYNNSAIQDFSCLIENKDNGNNTKTITVTTGQGDDFRGDVIMLANNVNTLRCNLEAGRGNQHFAVGIIDMTDFGDLPSSYEEDPSGVAKPADHLSNPNLTNPLETGWYILYKKHKKNKPITDINYFQKLSTAPTGIVNNKYVYNLSDTLERQYMVDLMTPKLRIGRDIDYERESHPDSKAKGDDLDYKDDEDLTVPFLASCGSKVHVVNQFDDLAYLHYWVDKNKDGDFKDVDTGNDIYGKVEVPANFANYLELPPMDLDPGEYFMRFRLSKNSWDVAYYGEGGEGEVEDVLKKIIEPAKGPSKDIQAGASCTIIQGTVELKDIQNYSTIKQYHNGNLEKEFTFYGITKTANGGIEAVTNDTIIPITKKGDYRYEITPSSKYSAGCPTKTIEYTIKAPLGLDDTDLDGIANGCDLDDDNDGILDTQECGGNNPTDDNDNDGVPAYLDDNDNDSSVGDDNNQIENGYDSDNDGIANHLDLDSDNDGILDIIESGNQDAIALDTDSNGRIDNDTPNGFGTNGVANAIETSEDSGQIQNQPIDNDNDNTLDFLDLDSDNDGCPDAKEGGKDLSVFIFSQGTVTGGTGSSATLNLGNNVDANGIPIIAEGGQSLGTSKDESQSDCSDSDGDGVVNMEDFDDDNDGILDTDETERCAGLIWNDEYPGGSAQSSSGTDPTTQPPLTINDVTLTFTKGEPFKMLSNSFYANEDYWNSRVNKSAMSNYPEEEQKNIFSIYHEGLYQDGRSYTIEFSEPVYNLSFNIEDIDINRLYNIGCDKVKLILTKSDNTLYELKPSDISVHPQINVVENNTFIGTSNEDNEIRRVKIKGIKEFIKKIEIVLTDNDQGNIWEDTPGATLIGIGDISFCKGVNPPDKDTDGDGIVDRLDLDSDNDGCPDAIEGAGNFTNENLVDAQGTVAVGTGSTAENKNLGNNVYIPADNEPNRLGVPKLAEAGQGIGVSLDASKNDCLDSDNDGIPDYLDLDDDNDGILDTEEKNCYVSLNWEDYPDNGQSVHRITNAAVPFTIPNSDGIQITCTKQDIGTDPNAHRLDRETTIESSTNQHHAWGWNYNNGEYLVMAHGFTHNNWNETAIVEDVYSEYMFEFSTAVANLTFDLLNMVPARNLARVKLTILDENHVEYVLQPQDYTLEEGITYTAPNTFSGDGTTLEDYVFRKATINPLPIKVKSLKLTFKSSSHQTEGSVSVGLSRLSFQKECDTDGDGIPNRLDLDSDNDGCLDAIEGAGNFTNEILVDAEGTVAVGTGSTADNKNLGNYVYTVADNEPTRLGVPQIAEAGQGKGVSQDSDKNECIDSDNDGIPDYIDLDDDNDGILDDDEIGRCSSLIWNDEYPGGSSEISSGTDPTTQEPITINNINVTFTKGEDINVGGEENPISQISRVNKSAMVYYPQDEQKNIYSIKQNCLYKQGKRYFIEFDSPVYNLSFNLYNIDQLGNGKDKVKLILTTANNTPYELKSSDVSVDPDINVVDNNTFIGTQNDFDSPETRTVKVTGIQEFIRKIEIVFINDDPDTFFPDMSGSVLIGIGDISFCKGLNDPDNDGIPSHLDLDSDNDGCPDAIEGTGGFTNDSLVDAEGTVEVGTSSTAENKNLGNDVYTAADNEPNRLGIPKVAGAGQATGVSQDASKNECIDSDNDDIPDYSDLDDDNDGILDTEETCSDPNKSFNWEDFPNNGQANQRITSTPVSVTIPNTDGIQLTCKNKYIGEKDEEHWSIDRENEIMSSADEVHYSPIYQWHYQNGKYLLMKQHMALKTDNFTIVDEDVYSEYTFEFSSAVENLTFELLNMVPWGGSQRTKLTIIDENNTEYVLQPQDYTLAPDITYTSPNTFSGGDATWENYVFRKVTINPLPIKVKSFKITFNSTEHRGGEGAIFIGLSRLSFRDKECDTDGDGIPNRLDLDSDNDGCLDAIEGAGNFTNDNLVDAEGTVAVGTGSTADNKNLGNYVYTVADNEPTRLGVPQIAEAGQGKGVSQDSDKNECIDSDNDGIPDYIDLDDDNDGILDTEESNGTTDIDTDADGIPNRLDLDSDNDGCLDAIEGAGDFTNANLVDAEGTIAVGMDSTAENKNLGNDVYTEADNEPTRLGVPKVAGAGQNKGVSQNKDTNGCLDSDNDGIPDYIDLDDDNDGILDIVESSCGESIRFDWNDFPHTNQWSEVINSTTSPFTIPNTEDIQITCTKQDIGTNPDASVIYRTNSITRSEDEWDWDYHNGEYLVMQQSLNAGDWDNNTIIEDVYSEYTFEFSSPVAGLTFDLLNMVPKYDLARVKLTILDANNTEYVLQPDDYTLEEGITYTEHNTFSGGDATWENYAFRKVTIKPLPIKVKSLKVIFKSSEHGSEGYTEIGLSSFSFREKECDTDNDGIPNRLDLDSDNDGCLDAIEGAGGFTNENLIDADGTVEVGTSSTAENKNLGNEVYTSADNEPTRLGVPKVAGAGQDKGISQDKDTNGCLDSDNDGIADIIDLDDDNDGILDTEESQQGTTDLDTDADGIPNRLDLDSDNDGCPDAIEGAGGFTNENLVNAEGTVAVGTGSTADNKNLGNEVYTSADNEPTRLGVPKVAGAGQDKGISQNKDANGCLDSDNDGIPDYLDLDDDNDGILDTEESSCEKSFNWEDYPDNGQSSQRITSTPVSFTIPNASGVQITCKKEDIGTKSNAEYLYRNNRITSSYSDDWDYNNGAYLLMSHTFFHDDWTSNTIIEDVYSEYTFEFSNAVSNLTFDLLNINPRWGLLRVKLTILDENNTEYVLQPQDYTLEQDITYSVPNTFSGGNESHVASESFRKVVINPLPIKVKSFKITLKTSEPWTEGSVVMGLSRLSFRGDCDTDGDGIPNRLDLDSDGDGCADALEGGDAINSGDLVTSAMNGGSTNVQENLGTTVGTTAEVDNGVPTIVNSGQKDTDGKIGQSVHYAQDNTKSSCKNYWYGGTVGSETDWNLSENWTQGEVPMAGTDIEFATADNNNGKPALQDLHVLGTSTSPTVIHNLINRSDKALVVPADKHIVINGIVTGSETVEKSNKIKVLAEANRPNGTIIFKGQPCGNPIFGTIQMYAKGEKKAKQEWTDNIEGSPTYNKKFVSSYEWQHFGVPVESVVANPTLHGSFLREYDETYNAPKSYYNKWHTLNNASSLTAFKGYEITQDVARTYEMSGAFQFCDKTVTMTRRAAAVQGSTDTNVGNRHYGLGQNIFGNSYTASINVDKIVFPDEVEKTVYLYNTGRFYDWATDGGINDGNSLTAGQYTAIPKNASPVLEGRIPSMNGFLLKFTDDETIFNGADATVTLKYADSGVLPNTRPQTLPQEELSYLDITLKSKSTIDKLYLLSQEGTTEGFDNGWDGRKFFGTPTAFIYTETEDGHMQVNTSERLDNKVITFYANQDVEYTLSINKKNLYDYENLTLLDLVSKKVIPLDKDTITYQFKANQSNVAEKRFRIVNSENITENMFDAVSKLSGLFYDNSKLQVSNHTQFLGSVQIFDITGRNVFEAKMKTGNNLYTVNLKSSVYSVHLSAGDKETKSFKIMVK